MGNLGWVDIIFLVLYFGAMAALGPFFARKGRTTEGYFLGDRQFPGWLLGFSLFATSISSVTFMAYPADAFKTAWYRMTPNYMLPVAVIVATVFFLPFFRRTRITSAYEYLEGRFGPITRLYAACAFILMQVVRVSLILYLVSLVVHEITGIDRYASILIGGVITSFYTVLGGIRAVVWTDFIQAIVLFGGGVFTLFVIVSHMPGGLGQILSEAWEAGKFGMRDLEAGSTELQPVTFSPDFFEKSVTLLLLVGLSHWLTEYSANQNVVQRYAASRSARQARIAMWVCCAFSVPTWALFMFLGTAMWVFTQHHHDPHMLGILSGEMEAEQVLPYFIIQYLPPGVTGVVIAGVLAAAMSSLSSSINAVSAVSLVDVYKRHIAPGRTDRHYVIVAKLVGVVLAVIMITGAAILMAAETTTLQHVATILTALTAGGLLGLYMLGFFTKVGDDRSMIAGIVCTMAYSLWMALTGLDFLPESLQSPIHGYYTGLIGHVIMFMLGFFFAALLPKRPRDLRNLTVWTQDDTPLD